jgi:hypothetical protein
LGDGHNLLLLFHSGIQKPLIRREDGSVEETWEGKIGILSFRKFFIWEILSFFRGKYLITYFLTYLALREFSRRSIAFSNPKIFQAWFSGTLGVFGFWGRVRGCPSASSRAR